MPRTPDPLLLEADGDAGDRSFRVRMGSLRGRFQHQFGGAARLRNREPCTHHPTRVRRRHRGPAAGGRPRRSVGHAELDSSDPADKAVLDTPPTVITLTFDEGVVGKSSFKLIGPGGDTVGTGGPAKDGDDTMTLDGLALTPGAYTIEWTSVADDGDVERGTLTFTVNEPTPAPATPTPAPSQASTAPTASPSPAPTATPVPSPSVDPEPVATSSSTDVLFPIIAALALIGVIGALLLRRNRAA